MNALNINNSETVDQYTIRAAYIERARLEHLTLGEFARGLVCDDAYEVLRKHSYQCDSPRYYAGKDDSKPIRFANDIYDPNKRNINKNRGKPAYIIHAINLWKEELDSASMRFKRALGAQQSLTSAQQKSLLLYVRLGHFVTEDGYDLGPYLYCKSSALYERGAFPIAMTLSYYNKWEKKGYYPRRICATSGNSGILWHDGKSASWSEGCFITHCGKFYFKDRDKVGFDFDNPHASTPWIKGDPLATGSQTYHFTRPGELSYFIAQKSRSHDIWLNYIDNYALDRSTAMRNIPATSDYYASEAGGIDFAGKMLSTANREWLYKQSESDYVQWKSSSRANKPVNKFITIPYK